MKKLLVISLTCLFLFVPGCTEDIEVSENEIEILKTKVELKLDEDDGIFEETKEGEVVSSIIPLNLNYNMEIKYTGEETIAKDKDDIIAFKIYPKSELEDIFLEDKFGEKFNEPKLATSTLEPNQKEELKASIAVDQELEGNILEHQDPDEYGPYIEEKWLKDENEEELKELAKNVKLHLYKNDTKFLELPLE
ncbi:hypothetical protein [Natranaerofaba carboxydovora]|uniref:hypothetical protein n=1 Tax=Natranaerofaba carboxydovora TaxID=2742683 RepID=UPI001F133FF5|nr:hypothetical protein [Natranaerofaba carboxydovora]UMZ72972.1 hypothetical protein ACONDI_00513 [Natranaerofaba carboxydovora]